LHTFKPKSSPNLLNQPGQAVVADGQSTVSSPNAAPTSVG
jgi:hypothetical protein